MPFPNIGPGELILILIIALVILGPGKLPDVAQSLGKSVREFRKAATDVTDAAKLEPGDAPTTSTPAPNTLTDASAPNRLEGSAAKPSPTDTDGPAATS
jgi:sec-independent protein translocase protein TatA